MCGYDPLYYYEKALDEAYLAQQYGFDTYEEYYEAMKDQEGDRIYDSWEEDKI